MSLNHPRLPSPVYVLGNHVSLVNVSLDLLSHARTLDAQAVLDAVRQALRRVLLRGRQQVRDAVVARHLQELCLPPRRVHGVLQTTCHGVFVEFERVRAQLLKGCRRRAGRDQGSGWPAGKEALQGLWQALGELDELRRRSHYLGECVAWKIKDGD